MTAGGAPALGLFGELGGMGFMLVVPASIEAPPPHPANAPASITLTAIPSGRQ
jgi:hypothetical protein